MDVDYRFCSVFADTRRKMATVWHDRGSYAGFAKHLQDVGTQFDHINLHPGIWRECRPLSSTPAHLTRKAAQRVSVTQTEHALHGIRRAFFERALDISNADVLEQLMAESIIKEVLKPSNAAAASWC